MDFTKRKWKPWLIAVLPAVAAGVYFRLVGLGTWPLATDEYYVYRSISFILTEGLPRFADGGYYTRGLLFQYATAPLLLMGMSPELAIRTIPAASSLLSLGAIAMLANRIGGMRMAGLLLAVVSLSAWDIEMARFGRMYAPFQALCLWYLYHAYCLVTTGELKRWRWLLTLSGIAPLVWEGGVFLILFNFLPLLMGRSCWRTRHLLLAAALLLASPIILADFRLVGSDLPGEVTSSETAQDGRLARVLGRVPMLVPFLLQSPVWASAYVILGITVTLLLGRVAMRATASRPTLLIAAVTAVLLMLNQVLLAALVLTTLFLIKFLRPQTFVQPPVQALSFSLCLLGMFWIAYTAFNYDSITDGGTLNAGIRTLLSFPNVIETLAWPWLSVIPMISGIVLIGAVASTALAVRTNAPQADGVRLILASILVAIALIGAAPTVYGETRYSFFLYPLLLLLCTFAVHMGLGSLPKRAKEAQSVGAIVLVLMLFAGNHFHFSHVVRVEQYEANFRVGYAQRLKRHYYPREDVASVARFIAENAAATDAVVTTSVAVTHYLNFPSYIYLDSTDSRYVLQACCSGERERWTNAPLLSSINEVEHTARTHDGRTWFIVDRGSRQSAIWNETLALNDEYALLYTTPDDAFDVYQY